jgi:threonine dehydratase
VIPLDEIRAAADTIADVAVRTPVLGDHALDGIVGAAVVAKDESAQVTGSFKFRGAFTRLAAIPPADRPHGVVAVSSGNHGAAVAGAAALLGLRATVHVPHDVAPAKRALIEEYGAEIVEFERATPDRELAARRQVAETGATFVHPFEDPLVQRGQGTTALELHEQAGRIDVLVVPMSGGGLMAGCASAITQLDPGCVVVGVEPEAADDTRRSFDAGERITIRQPDTIADGLAVTAPGERTFAINRRLVSRVLTVTDADLVDAMRLARDHLGRRLEPSGAAALAAVVVHGFPGRRVGVVLSGGNIDERRFCELVDG